MVDKSNNPLIVQSDKTLLLEIHNPSASLARDDIAAFTELVKSPEHIHTYQITALSLWNAVAAGYTHDVIMENLYKWSKYDVPDAINIFIKDICSRYGALKLLAYDDTDLLLKVEKDSIYREISANKFLSTMLTPYESDTFKLSLFDRGNIKISLIKLGYPVEDLIPLKQGDSLPLSLRKKTRTGESLEIRDYQNEAVNSFLGSNIYIPGLGYGTIVLPCGSGKTIIGIEAMRRLQTKTLIITTNTAAVHQWIDELQDKTDISKDDIGEYTGSKKELKPVTVCTYQILTWRASKEDPFIHFSIFSKNNWGLIIYDEVHLLPAPVFKITAEIQSSKRLGMTATLVREDNREDEVFALIGPKRYDVPWKVLEHKGWIAKAVCTEIRIPLPQNLEIPYAVANKREKFKIASKNPQKNHIVHELIKNHREDHILIIGHYLDQLRGIAKELNIPIITGSTKNSLREDLYRKFRNGTIRILAVSKVANFAIDLPDASMAIQISGTFGSRQEEAQRLGRLLRPKKRNALMFTLVSQYSSEEEFAANRQKFLTEQGYTYHLEIWE